MHPQCARDAAVCAVANRTPAADEPVGGERNGRRLDSDCCIVFQVENGRIVSGREHFFDLHNWDAFWA